MKNPSGSFNLRQSTKFSRREVLAATTIAAAVSSSVAAEGQITPSLTDFGGVGDGTTDNFEAFRRALSAIGPSGTLYVPPGVFKMYDEGAFRGAQPLVLTDGQKILGESGRSILGISRRKLSAFYGLAIAGDGIQIDGLEIRCESALPGWTAGVAITGNSRDTTIRQTAFVGQGGRSGHYGVIPIGVDLEHFSMEQCHFRGLDFGFFRQTSDTASYQYLNFIDCTGVDCTEVIEINAPGLLFVETKEGSSILYRVTDPAGGIIAATALKKGQPVRCEAFPAGTRVAGTDRSGQVVLSNAAIFSSKSAEPFRLSAGGASHGRISNLVAREIGQWAVGMANCDDWDIDVAGEGIGYELVHIEDASRDIRVKVSGSNTNLQRGVVGSPDAENGMVQISSGSRDIRVQFDSVDLSGSNSTNPVGICVQAAGIMGTTGREVAPTGIQIAGTIICGSRSRAVVAFESELIFDDLTLIGSPPSNNAVARMRLAGCKISGTVRTNTSRQSLIQQEANSPIGEIQILAVE